MDHLNHPQHPNLHHHSHSFHEDSNTNLHHSSHIFHEDSNKEFVFPIVHKGTDLYRTLEHLLHFLHQFDRDYDSLSNHVLEGMNDSIKAIGIIPSLTLINKKELLHLKDEIKHLRDETRPYIKHFLELAEDLLKYICGDKKIPVHAAKLLMGIMKLSEEMDMPYDPKGLQVSFAQQRIGKHASSIRDEIERKIRKHGLVRDDYELDHSTSGSTSQHPHLSGHDPTSEHSPHHPPPP